MTTEQRSEDSPTSATTSSLTLTLELSWDSDSHQWLWPDGAPNCLPDFVPDELMRDIGYEALDRVLTAAANSADRWLNPEHWSESGPFPNWEAW